jgi:DNA-binding transcriptional LysR family regulator
MNEFDQSKIRSLDGGLLLIFRELLIRRRASDVADHLGLSPSAVSHALQRLRLLFDEPLFIRRAHGLEPTQRALDLGPRIEALIGLIDEAVSGEPGFDPMRSRRRFRIVCPDAVASLLGDRLVEIFRRQAPGATFSTRDVILERALRAVRRGEADVALGVFRQIPAGFVAQRLYDDDYCVIARKGHPRIQGAIDAQTYGRVGHVFIGNPDGALADEAPFDREAIAATYGGFPGPDQVRTHAYVAQWETAMLIVSSGDAKADCPRRLALRFADRLGLQVLDPPFPLFQFTIQAVRRAATADPGLDWLMDRLAEAAL